MEQKGQEHTDTAETEDDTDLMEDVTAAKVSQEEHETARTPVALVSRDLPAAPINIPPFALPDVGSLETFADPQFAMVSSPTLTISTVSDLTPTEFGEDLGDGGEGGPITRHKLFYLESGDVEVLCGHTVFRVHSPIVSFSSSKLRDVLSPSTLLNAPEPEGCPQVVFADSVEDFETLMKMIYTPGWGLHY